MITVPFSLSSVPFHLATVCYVCYMSILSHQTKRKGSVSQDFNLFILRIPICLFFSLFFFSCLLLNFCACIRLIVYVRVLRLNHITLQTIFMSIQIPVYLLSQYPWSYDAINVYDCTLSICTGIVYNTKSNIQKREAERKQECKKETRGHLRSKQAQRVRNEVLVFLYSLTNPIQHDIIHGR